MSAKKVLFLDVDGVLNSASFDRRYFKEHGIIPIREDILDEDAIYRLRIIVENTGAEIVLSSAWRILENTREAVREWLEKFDLHFTEVTPYPQRDWNRGDEIMAWLREHQEVDRIAILDDATCLGELSPFLILTTYEHGLLNQHITPAVALLNSSEDIFRPWRLERGE